MSCTHARTPRNELSVPPVRDGSYSQTAHEDARRHAHSNNTAVSVFRTAILKQHTRMRGDTLIPTTQVYPSSGHSNSQTAHEDAWRHAHSNNTAH
eukprot:39170-Chlamydomonas_euryale.AAC.13